MSQKLLVGIYYILVLAVILMLFEIIFFVVIVIPEQTTNLNNFISQISNIVGLNLDLDTTDLENQAEDIIGDDNYTKMFGKKSFDNQFLIDREKIMMNEVNQSKIIYASFIILICSSILIFVRYKITIGLGHINSLIVFTLTIIIMYQIFVYDFSKKFKYTSNSQLQLMIYDDILKNLKISSETSISLPTTLPTTFPTTFPISFPTTLPTTFPISLPTDM